MNSEERRAARRRRREAERAEKKARLAEACTFEAMTDMNALHKAQRQAGRGVGWKGSTQRYQIHWLLNINKAHNDLTQGHDVCRGFHEFDICERGKVRHISSVHFSERVIQKSLAQNVLIPSIKPSLIDRNAANIKGKGVSYSLACLKKDLVRHYARHGAEGYILLADFSNYFASIQHEHVKNLVCAHVSDPLARELEMRFIDVQGDVGLGLGSEPNQICAVSLPSPVDHFVVECLGVEAFGRYMDDSYMIHPDKDYLNVCLALLKDKCAQYGIVLNDKKTHVTKLARGFTFLKKRVSFGDSGKVVMRPCRESITRERRKLKKQAALVAVGVMTMEDVTASYQSWRGSLADLDAHGTLLSMDALFRELFAGGLAMKDPPPRANFVD